MVLARLPRVDLGKWPTPLHELPRLSDALGGPRIFIKRDDLSGLAFGGNKCRKLEYLLSDAKQRGVDTLIATGSAQSNFALQMAAAACKLGMKSYLVLFKGLHPEMQGNMLLHSILGSKVSLVDIADSKEMFTVLPQRMNQLADELRSQGCNPWIIPVGGSVPLGTAGWAYAAEEIERQLGEQGIDIQHVILANGSGGTQAGLVLGFKYLRTPVKVIGISVLSKRNEAKNTVVTQVNETAKLLGLDIAMTPEEVTVYDDYIGQGYGIPTREGIEAVKLVARTEAILLDPVYTGKSMAGLVDLIRKGVFSKNESVLFVHSGGGAADFAYSQELTNY